MRTIIAKQMQVGEIDFKHIKIDLTSRDEMSQLFLGLQYIFITPKFRVRVFNSLKKIIPAEVDMNNGRNGMTLWKIFVLDNVRLNCHWDYDKLTDIANNHRTLRQVLGHGLTDDNYRYPLQTIKDNLRLLTPEISAELSQVVVDAGHELTRQKADEALSGSADSFPVETNVHFPTDINLLLDAMRKTITLTGQLCSKLQVTTWHQSKYHFRKIKRLFRTAQQTRRSKAKNAEKRARREELIITAHTAYIDLATSEVKKITRTLAALQTDSDDLPKIQELEKYIRHGERQINQIRRRVLLGETIPHHEKVFSLFEEHTEWISKGKAGVSQELGLQVAIVRDRFGFILHHHVMEKEHDVDVAVSLIEATQKRFPNFKGCSFDGGFYNPENAHRLAGLLDWVVLPKKGKLSAAVKAIINTPEYIQRRHQHSAVESSINALENHGLSRCPDHAIDGFKRYVAIAVLARNLQILGRIIQVKEQKRCERKRQSCVIQKK